MVWFCIQKKILILHTKGRVASLFCMSAVRMSAYEWSPEGGELSLFACPGKGNRPPRNKNLANPGGHAQGGGGGDGYRAN